MMTNLIIFFAVLFVGTECRSIVLSNSIVNGSNSLETKDFPISLFVSKDLEEPMKLISADQDSESRRFRLDRDEVNRVMDPQEENLEFSVAEFADRSDNVKEYEERAVQFVRQLKQILESLSTNTQVERSKRANNWINEIEQNGSTILDGNKKIVLIDGNSLLDDILEFIEVQDMERQANDDRELQLKTDTFHTEELDAMLSGLKSEIGEIERLFEKLCNKHHSMKMSSLQSEIPHVIHAKKDVKNE